TFSFVLLGLALFTVFIYMLSSVVDGNTQDKWVASDPARMEALVARTAPVGRVAAQGGEAITIAPTASGALTFRDPLPTSSSHGEGEHGDDAMAHGAEGDHHDDASTAVAAVAEAAEEAVADVEEAAEELVAAAADIDGQAVYSGGCNACHLAGIAGAPKVGDAAAWEARLAQGTETLYEHAIKGWNSMPAKGGFAYLSDEQVKAAVDYMVSQVQ
ncbi:MAG: c-type cytochrome, partial [Pseudomonadota bacterium]